MLLLLVINLPELPGASRQTPLCSPFSDSCLDKV